MDADHYDEFGNYIGPELDDTDSEEEIEEQESEMPLVPTGVEVTVNMILEKPFMSPFMGPILSYYSICQNSKLETKFCFKNIFKSKGFSVWDIFVA